MESTKKSKSIDGVTIQVLIEKKNLIQAQLNTKVEESKQVEDKKTYIIKKFFQRYNNSIEPVLKKVNSKYDELIQDVLFDTAVETEGKITYSQSKEVPDTNKEQGKIRNKKINKLNNEREEEIKKTVVEFEPFLTTEESIINTFDEFTKEELKGFLF